jgi:hypothetical protein
MADATAPEVAGGKVTIAPIDDSDRMIAAIAANERAVVLWFISSISNM